MVYGLGIAGSTEYSRASLIRPPLELPKSGLIGEVILLKLIDGIENNWNGKRGALIYGAVESKGSTAFSRWISSKPCHRLHHKRVPFFFICTKEKRTVYSFYWQFEANCSKWKEILSLGFAVMWMTKYSTEEQLRKFSSMKLSGHTNSIVINTYQSHKTDLHKFKFA